MLLPYMGGRGQPNFQTATATQSKVFVCPSDGITVNWGSINDPGFTVFNNTTLNNGQSMRHQSYGINCDITCLHLGPVRTAPGPHDGLGVLQRDELHRVLPHGQQGEPGHPGLRHTGRLPPDQREAQQDPGDHDDPALRRLRHPPGARLHQLPLDRPDILVYTTDYVCSNSDTFLQRQQADQVHARRHRAPIGWAPGFPMTATAGPDRSCGR